MAEKYDEIYERMRQAYITEGGSDFDEASDIAIRLKVLAGEIYNAQTNADWLKRQTMVTTAQGEYLDYFAMQRGLERKSAKCAQGEIGFYINEAKDHDIVIPVGTVVATTDDEPLRFSTTEQGILSAGSTLVNISAQAEKAGRSGNIDSGKATVPVNVPTEIDYVSNASGFTDGADEETDGELRERIRKTFESPSNGTNIAYYEQLALSVQGIAKAGVVGKVRGVGTVNVYVYGNNRAASTSEIAQAQELISKNRELNVDVKVYTAQAKSCNLTATVNAKSGYTELSIKNACTQAFESCLYSIPIGGKLYLSALGKSLMDTGCIENYTFDTSMTDVTLSAAQCIVPGTVTLEVS